MQEMCAHRIQISEERTQEGLQKKVSEVVPSLSAWFVFRGCEGEGNEGDWYHKVRSTVRLFFA